MLLRSLNSLLIGTLVWALFLLPLAGAQEFFPSAGPMLMAGPQGAPQINGFLQCTSDTSNLTTYTFNGVNIGPYAASRGIIVVIHGEDAATNFNIATVTVGGVTATQAIDHDGGVVINGLFLVPHATQPTTSSDTVVVTFSEAITGAAICIYTIYDKCNGGASDYQLLNSDVLFDTDSGSMDISDPSFSSGYGFLATTMDTTGQTLSETCSGSCTETYEQSNAEFSWAGVIATSSPGWSGTVSGTGDADQAYFTCGT